MIKIKYGCLTILFCLWASAATADDFKIGAEFTVTNPQLKAAVIGEETPLLRAALEAMATEMVRRCGSSGICVVNKDSHKGELAYRASFRNGFWFLVTVDFGVLEFPIKPVSLSEFEDNAALMQEYIFDAAARIGMRPDHRISGFGGGHWSIGLTSFDDDLLLFRNFFVDQINHYELSAGIFEYDMDNSPAFIAHASEDNMGEMRDVINAVDTGRIISIAQFAAAIENVYAHTPTSPRDQSINVRPITLFKAPVIEGDVTGARVELRGHRAPRNIGEARLIARMYHARLNFLRRFHQPIRLTVSPSTFSHEGTPEQIGRFKVFLNESSLNVDDYRVLLDRRYINVLNAQRETMSEGFSTLEIEEAGCAAAGRLLNLRH